MTICIYSGRFQPFAPHHYKTYLKLKTLFNKVYIATTNVTNETDSPFNFETKRKIILKYGIPYSDVVCVKSPYKAHEITGNYDLEKTVVVFAVGEKDKSRINFKKQDGSNSYLKPYFHGLPHEYANTSGYVYFCNTLKNGPKILNSTEIREKLKFATSETFKALLNWNDEELEYEIKSSLNNCISNQSKRKHINHLYEDETTVEDIIQVIRDICRVTFYEKYDGRNIKFKFDGNRLLVSRNKTQIKSPIGIDALDLSLRNHKSYDLLKEVYVDSLRCVENCMMKKTDWIDAEILHQSGNVIDYGQDLKIALHALVEFDETGMETSRNIDGLTELANTLNAVAKELNESISFIAPKPLSLPDCNFNHIITELQTFPQNTLIMDFDKENFTLLKTIILKFENEVIKKLFPANILDYNKLKRQISDISIQVQRCSDVKKTIKYQESIMTLDLIGGVNSCNSVEGAVFAYMGNMYKCTGSFAPLNQILGLFKFG